MPCLLLDGPARLYIILIEMALGRTMKSSSDVSQDLWGPGYAYGYCHGSGGGEAERTIIIRLIR